jgi:putative oxidoreductase
MESWIKESLKEPLTSVGLLIMRVTVGLTMAIIHGWPKLANFSERAETFRDPLNLGSTHLSLGLATGAEFFCSLLLVVGLFSRAAAIPLLFTMFVIVFIVQAGNDMSGSRELALLFGFCYLTLIFTGPGRFSLDHLLMKRKQTDE